MSTVGTPLNVWWKSQQADAGPVPPGASLVLQPPSAPRVSMPSLPLIFFLPFHLFSFCVCPPKSRLRSLRHTSVSAEGKRIWEQPIHSVALGAAILLPDMTLPN